MLVAATLVTFHVAALQHNLSIWQRVSVMADATCSDARWLTRNGPHEVEAIGLPGTIDGVYFFANGLKECLEMEHGGVWNIRKGSDAGSPSEFGKTVLLWNDQTNKLSLAAR